MKTITTLSLIILLASAHAAQAQNSFDSFWQSFKTAVSKRDVETIARLSSFRSRCRTEYRRKEQGPAHQRYRQVFNEQTNAAACFEKAKPR